MTTPYGPSNYTLAQAQADVANLRGQIAHLLARAEILQLQVDSSLTAAPGALVTMPDTSTWNGSGITGPSGGLVVSNGMTVNDTGGSPTLAVFGGGAVRFPSNVANQVAIDGAGNLYLQNNSSWATLFSTSSGVPQYTKGNGLGITGAIPSVQVDTGANSSTSSSVTALTKAWSIPAGDAEAGTVYRIRTKLSGNWPAQIGTPYIMVNGTNTAIFPNSGTYAAGFYTSGDAYVADTELILVIVTNGSGGTARIGGFQLWQDVTGHSTPFVTPFDSGGATLDATISINTSSATTMAFGWKWGATASHAIASNFSIFTREGP